jgi:hypothetical protein
VCVGATFFKRYIYTHTHTWDGLSAFGFLIFSLPSTEEEEEEENNFQVFWENNGETRARAADFSSSSS